MNASTVERLLEINRHFYSEHGRSFSETRFRAQPGVRRVIGTMRGDEDILDLGCGNGIFAHELSLQGHKGSYTGLDYSLPLLEEARRRGYTLQVVFLEADLVRIAEGSVAIPGRTSPSLEPFGNLVPGAGSQRAKDLDKSATMRWHLVSAFAVMHHMPGLELRQALLKRVHDWLEPSGRFVISNWQFTSKPRFRSRILPWSSMGLSAGDVDAGDHLVDWHRDGKGVRYLHEYSEDELHALAAQCGFSIQEVFRSDGIDGTGSLYQVWQRS